MGLKAVFNTLKREGYIVKDLDQYLIKASLEDNGRAINVNAPSQASGCILANFLSRNQFEKDGATDPRSQRIFDNGSYTHERLQTYLKKQGMLLMDEVPLRNDEYNIQGHTDGFLALRTGVTYETVPLVVNYLGEPINIIKLNKPTEIGILEIKSINTNGFSKLKDAKDEHKLQAMVYCYCAEERRKLLLKKYKHLDNYIDNLKKEIKYFESLYTHIKSGSKYTREEKIAHKVREHILTDSILFQTITPVNKVIFLYEDKNDQNLKEYCVKTDEDTLNTILERYKYLNECVKKNKRPEREGTSKSCQTCRWCNYKNECWVV